MRDLDTLLGALTDRLLQAEARIEELERHETPGAVAFGWAGAVGMLQMMPGLVGLWPGSGVAGDHDGVADMSGNGLHLVRNGGASIGASSVSELVPAMFFNGINAYFSHADAAAFDISGTEAIVQRSPSYRGLTFGGWFRPEATGSRPMAKGAVTGNSRAYALRYVQTAWSCAVSGNGTNEFVSAGVAGANDEWQFVSGRFVPSAAVQIFVGKDTLVMGEETASIPAALNNSAAGFAIGGEAIGANLYTGRAALCFLCAAAVPDVMIETFYQYSKGLFGL